MTQLLLFSYNGITVLVVPKGKQDYHIFLLEINTEIKEQHKAWLKKKQTHGTPSLCA